MKLKLVLTLIAFFCTLTVNFAQKKQSQIYELISGDSLHLNLSLNGEETSGFFDSVHIQALKVLRISNGTGWMAYTYYYLNGEQHLKVVSPEKTIGWVEVAPLIQKIGKF